MVDQRFIPLSGIHNLRDYGGYSATGGARVKTGILWRSGHHADAGPADLDAVSDLALKSVIDLRGTSEFEKHPCRRPEGFDAEVLRYDGETAGLNLAPHLEAAGGALDPKTAHAAMRQLYADLPDRGPLVEMLRRYFAVLTEGRGPSLVHCAAGKDRTGMAVDLLHHVLGVHRDDAMEDYLLTNQAPNNEARIAHGMAMMGNKWGGVTEETARIVMGVHEDYLHAARGALVERFGSTDAFLEGELGVTPPVREAVRLHLVES